MATGGGKQPTFRTAHDAPPLIEILKPSGQLSPLGFPNRAISSSQQLKGGIKNGHFQPVFGLIIPKVQYDHWHTKLVQTDALLFHND